MMKVAGAVCALFTALAAQAQTAGGPASELRSARPSGDEIGMARTLGPRTWQRCAEHLANPNSKSYEISHIRSNTMPQSPFGTPMKEMYRPTVGIPGTRTLSMARKS